VPTSTPTDTNFYPDGRSTATPRIHQLLPDGHAHGNACGYTNLPTDVPTATHTDANFHPNGCSDRDVYGYTDINTDGHADVNAYLYIHPNGCANGNAYGYTDVNADGRSHRDAHVHAAGNHAYLYCDRYADSYQYTYTWR
jgi:hypothetical protein